MALAAILGVMGLAVPTLQMDHIRQVSEDRALQTIAAIHDAQAKHFTRFGRYAGELNELAVPRDLAQTGELGGYRFVLARTSGGYTVGSNPIRCGTSGTRSFFSSEKTAIHERACPQQATATDAVLR